MAVLEGTLGMHHPLALALSRLHLSGATAASSMALVACINYPSPFDTAAQLGWVLDSWSHSGRLHFLPLPWLRRHLPNSALTRAPKPSPSSVLPVVT